MEYNKLAQNLQNLMQEKDLTIYDVAEGANIAPSSVSKYINGRVIPRPKAIKKVADYFNISTAELLGVEHPTCSILEQVQPLKQVDFNRDITPLLPVMIGAYEKANIHAPYNTSKDASEILSSETEEALEEVRKIDDIVISESKNFSFNILDISDLQEIKAHAMSGICELLQVMAVCNKYEQLLEREDNETSF